MKFIPSYLLIFSLFLGTAHSLQALLLFGWDNETNLSAPVDVDIPWTSSARIANFDETNASSPSGTAVHLGYGYMLTAHHVNNRSHVSFDGTSWYTRDTSYTPVQVATGVDLKIFKLTQTPSVAAAVLHNGGGELNTLGYHVSWGRGRASDDDIGTNVQALGGDATIDKRWGTNVVKAVQTTSWGSYTQEALVTVLGNNEGANETALATYDSGSPFFQEINNTIVLSGIAGAIEQQDLGNATFGEDRVTGSPFGKGDRNFLIQIGPYNDAILDIIPEPGVYAFALSFTALIVVLSGRRARRQFCPDRRLGLVRK